MLTVVVAVVDTMASACLVMEMDIIDTGAVVVMVQVTLTDASHVVVEVWLGVYRVVARDIQDFKENT